MRLVSALLFVYIITNVNTNDCNSNDDNKYYSFAGDVYVVGKYKRVVKILQRSLEFKG